MSTLKGFTGIILKINLTSREIKKTPLNEELAKKFLGGAGYACATLYPLLNKDTDPLGPDNILFFMGGPLLGSMGTCTGRMVVCAKSPISGIWGESNSGSLATVEIKKAGYDGIIIEGFSHTPVYIEIYDDKVEIKDASEIWGKGIKETTEILKKSEDWKRGKVISIGQAGENLIKYAIIGGEDRAFGRTGMGAVMGSKKLKAILIKGTKKVDLSKPDEFRETVTKVNKDLMDVFTNQMFHELGTSGGLNMYSLTGELPVKYYRTSIFENPDEISGATLQDRYLKRSRHCFACPIGCGRIVAIGENDLGLPNGEFEGPEYETIAGFGSMLNNMDLKAIIKANYLCNDYGIDTISVSTIISLLMDLIDQGKISSHDLDEIDLKWGNMNSVFQLLEKIAKREGIGKILGEGSDTVGKYFKTDQDQIATVRHIEVPYHDLRSSNGMAIAYAISPTYGASHCACDMYQTSLGQPHEEMDIECSPPKDNTVEMAITSARLMEFRALYSSIVMCIFANPPASATAKLIELGTGMNFDLEKLKMMSKRILAMKRLFNLKMGHTPADEKLPAILTTPLEEGGTEGNVPNVDFLFSEFYKYENWDPKTGIPSIEILEKLGLSEYFKQL